jgi:hypothetical protein
VAFHQALGSKIVLSGRSGAAGVDLRRRRRRHRGGHGHVDRPSTPGHTDGCVTYVTKAAAWRSPVMRF